MTGTSYSPSINPTLPEPTFENPIKGTKQDQTRDKLDRFLQITELTNENKEPYYKANKWTNLLNDTASSASTNNFIASLSAMQKILKDSKFRRSMPPSALQQAQDLFASIVADCGITGVDITSDKYFNPRSVLVRQGYEKLASQPGEGTSLATNVDPRNLYANSLGRQYFSGNEQLLLGQQYGLPLDQGMNPNGAAAQGLFMKFVAKHTNDPANYNLTVGGQSFGYTDLTNRDITTFTGDEYNAVREAFIIKAKKNGVDNAWLTMKDPSGREVPNDALFKYLTAVADSKVTATGAEPDKLKTQIQEQTAMYTAIKYFQISAAVEADRINNRAPTTVLAGNTPTTNPTTSPTPSSVDTAMHT